MIASIGVAVPHAAKAYFKRFWQSKSPMTGATRATCLECNTENIGSVENCQRCCVTPRVIENVK